MVTLQPVSSPDIECLCIELGKEIAFRRAFPILGYAAFLRSVIAAYKIHDGAGVRGVLLEIRPMNDFISYGERETLLLVYPEFQRRGIATRVMHLLCEAGDERFFISSKANSASTAFFQKQSCLELVDENERYRVFRLLRDTRVKAIVFESGLENVAEEFKGQRVHVVCVATGGLTMCDYFASTLGGLARHEKVWPETREANQRGRPCTFWPRLSLTAVPLPEWNDRPKAKDIEGFYRECFEEVAKINREAVKLRTLHMDLNGWGSQYHFNLARRVSEQVLTMEPSIMEIHFEPEAKGCRDSHL